MSAAERCSIDTNVAVYLLAEDPARANRAEHLLAGCSVLFSKDMQDGQQLDGLTILNPFR